MKRFLLKIFVWFFGILLIGLFLMNYKKYQFYGNGEARLKIEYYTKNATKYNTLIFGSSRMYRHINPTLLDSATSHKIKAYNLASGGTFFSESLYQFHQTPIDKNIKYVIFELQDLMPFENNAYSEKILYYHDIPTTSFEVKYHLKNKDWNSLFLTLTNFVSNIFYFKKLNRQELYHTEFLTFNNGYFPLEKDYTLFQSVRTQRAAYLKDTTQLTQRMEQKVVKKKMNVVWKNEIKSLEKECQDRGIKLILVSSLFTQPIDFSFLKKDSTTKILDFTSPKKFKEFYTYKNVHDNGHLNMRGSKIFTQKFADRLNNVIESEK
jgi:hypothetical protein